MQGSYLLWRIVENKLFRILPLFFIIYFLFLATAWPQLKSTLEFSDLSNRVNDQGIVLDKADWFLPAPQLIQMIVPDFFGNPTTRNYWGEFNYTEFVSFIGVIPVVFVLHAAFSLYQKKKKKKYIQKETLFFLSVLFVSLVMSLRNPVSVAQFKHNIPFLGASQPSRWIVITDLSLALLTSLGVHSFLTRKKSLFPPVLVILVTIVVLWFSLYQADTLKLLELKENFVTAQRNLILPTLELGFLLIVVIGMYGLSHFNIKIIQPINKYNKTLVVLACLSIVSFSGVRFASKFVPFTNPDFLYPETQTTTYLKENAGLHRYMTQDRRVLPPNVNLAYDLYTIEGYDPLYLFDYSRLIYATEHKNQEYRDNAKPFNRIVTADNVESPVLDLLGVKYIVTVNWLSQDEFKLVLVEGDTRLYENTQVFPRAFVTYSDSDYLEVTPDSLVEILEYKPKQVKMKINSEQSGYLILTDAYHPDWQAEIDGQMVEITNWYGLRRVPIEKGSHEIEFIYRYSYL
jgi:hypothetical protein